MRQEELALSVYQHRVRLGAQGGPPRQAEPVADLGEDGVPVQPGELELCRADLPGIAHGRSVSVCSPSPNFAGRAALMSFLATGPDTGRLTGPKAC